MGTLVELINEEQLKRLLGSVGEWNDWRKGNLEVIINLSGADLSGADLSGADLSGADLSGANLSRANLSRANLSRANLSGANLSRANLIGAYLNGADLSGADLRVADLSGADLKGADLKGADLMLAVLSGADLRVADLSGAVLIGAYLNGADLSGVNLDKADMQVCRSLRLCNNSIRGTKFSPRAKDPYSVLRRTYTGMMFTLVLVFTMVALAPFVVKAMTYSLAGNIQNNQLQIDCENIQDNSLTCARTLEIVLGFTEESENRWAVVSISIFIIFYNIIRYIVTIGMSGIREAEERSHHSPEWDEYKRYYYVHQYFLRWVFYGVMALTIFRIGSMLWTQVVIPVY